jgi:hypothetical protein
MGTQDSRGQYRIQKAPSRQSFSTGLFSQVGLGVGTSDGADLGILTTTTTATHEPSITSHPFIKSGLHRYPVPPALPTVILAAAVGNLL